MRDPRFRGFRVYVVVWPEHMIVKAGYTCQQRWRRFMARGASVHRLMLFDDWRPALNHETALHAYLGSRAPFAFQTSEESRWLLGNLGGSCETYRLPSWDVLDDLPPPPADRLLPTQNFEYMTRPVAP